MNCGGKGQKIFLLSEELSNKKDYSAFSPRISRFLNNFVVKAPRTAVTLGSDPRADAQLE